MPPTEPLLSIGHAANLLRRPWETVLELSERAGAAYQSFDMRAEGKQKWRHIDNPNDELKKVQRALVGKVLARINLPEGMFGAAAGGSVIDHARVHANASCVITLDLKDCFPSTSAGQVHAVFRRLLGCPERIASPFTKLTTLNGRLPQGAPTSPLLSHLVLAGTYEELVQLCISLNVKISFYMDDIALSGRHARRVVEKAINVLQRARYRIGSAKTTVMGKSSDKIITGLQVLDGKLRIPQRYMDAVHAELTELAASHAITARQVASIGGKVGHIRMICPEQAAQFDDDLRRIPAPSWQGHRVRRDEWQRCSGKAQCRANRQRRARLELSSQ